MTKFRYPTFEELQAVELAARRARSEEVARLVRAAGPAIKSLYTRVVSMLSARKHRYA
jgi:hypothetical protein